MSLDEGMLREVDEDIAEEKLVQDFKKYGPFAAVAIIALLAFVGGREYLAGAKIKTANAASAAYSDIVELKSTDPSAALEKYEEFSVNAPAGYKALAGLQSASILMDIKQRQGAIDTLLDVARDGDVPSRMQKLARIKAGYLAIEDGSSRVQQILDGMQTDGSVLGAHALEILGVTALQEKDYVAASTYFESIELSEVASVALKTRAEQYAALSHLGSNGVGVEMEGGGSGNDSLIDLFNADAETHSEAAPTEPEASEEPLEEALEAPVETEE